MSRSPPLDPELSLLRYVPAVPVHWRLGRKLLRMNTLQPRPTEGVIREDIVIANLEGTSDIRLFICRPQRPTKLMPAILWVHGGGMVIGHYKQDSGLMDIWAERLGALVISVDYRLAPEARAPAALDDCIAAWQWIVAQATTRGIDTIRMAVGGASAGGGLAASVVQRILDLGGIQPVFQLLIYPMLDDRTVTKVDPQRIYYIWTPECNRYSWTAFLGVSPGSNEVPPYASAARRLDLSGLPPAWIGVGSLDLFHDEDMEYARRLSESGVSVERYVAVGAPHAFDTLYGKADISTKFWDSHFDALRKALCYD